VDCRPCPLRTRIEGQISGKNAKRWEGTWRLANGCERQTLGIFAIVVELAQNRDLVVIERKVPRGYDRTVGQLLRHMGWIEENLAESGRQVRGIIVAGDVDEDLLYACRRLPDVSLFGYQLSVTVKKVSKTADS
jgi:endonuclease